jgi:hypothetical protein
MSPPEPPPKRKRSSRGKFEEKERKSLQIIIEIEQDYLYLCNPNLKYSANMKGFYQPKWLIPILLACALSVQAATDYTISCKQDAVKGSITVNAGQSKSNQASANISISGENSKITVEKEGVVSLSAGKSIVLHPGTRITAGCFLYATIEPLAKANKHKKKEVRLVTVEEKKKMDEQATLAVAATLFSPFPVCERGSLHSGDTENGSFYAGSNELSGVTSGEQRIVAINGLPSLVTAPLKLILNFAPAPVPVVFRPETTRVLRL